MPGRYHRAHEPLLNRIPPVVSTLCPPIFGASPGWTPLGDWRDAASSLLRWLAHSMSPVRDGESGGTPPPAGDELWTLPDAGDPDAIAEELNRRFRDRLRFFAARRLFDREGAEDVAQEVLRRVLEALRAGRIQNPVALPAFLFQTARNVCMQQARSEGRRSKAFVRLRAGGEEDPEHDPLTDLITAERREVIREALERLGPGDREILKLSYAEALGAEEIAARLQLTAGAVRVRRHRALNRLAELMGVTNRSQREL